jgi:hypothetical protein
MSQKCFTAENLAGTMGRYDRIHRGVEYSVRNIGARRWRWEVTPPLCVVGLHCQSGEVDGELRDAETVAQNVIEQQTGQYTL